MKLIFILCLLSLGCAGLQKSDDQYLWLEEIEGQKSLEWVRQHNQKTIDELQKNDQYRHFESELKKLVLDKDRIPRVQLYQDTVFNFWQDEKHVKGILRRASLASYRQNKPQWEVLIDFDELSKKDQKDWVYKGFECLQPQNNPCLISVSDGGKDASVVKEFDFKKKKFVEDGFNFPESIQRLDWLDQDTVLIATNFGPNSMTVSGYPRILKMLKRGQPLSSAVTLFEGKSSDVTIGPWVLNDQGQKVILIYNYFTFYQSQYFVMRPDHSLVKVPIPLDAEVATVSQGNLFFKLRSDYVEDGQTFFQGSILSRSFDRMTFTFGKSKLVTRPKVGESIQTVFATQDHLYMLSLQDVKSDLYKLNLQNKEWKREKVDLPSLGSIYIDHHNDFQNKFLVSYDSFLIPTSVYSVEARNGQIKIENLKSLPKKFDEKKLTVDQFFAVSKDGARIPYFVFRRKDLKYNGQNPTLLNGYGGFESSMNPYYSGRRGKLWVSQGGVFVLANLRGGGEYGPQWHKDGMLEKKQNVFDDFIAIAEDLIAKKITSPRHLGIEGGSNGGLLVGAVMTQRPDLFNAVICQVPLLDMLRYHHLLAGNSWVNEYGNPDDPKMKEVILKYSPFQNLKKNTNYPEVLFVTSTKDDRVHPGHARKMAAKLEDLGQKVFYYENTGGGHGADADLNDRIFRYTLEQTYLYEKLF